MPAGRSTLIGQAGKLYLSSSSLPLKDTALVFDPGAARRWWPGWPNARLRKNSTPSERLAESVESVGRDLLKELPALSKGQAIIAGAVVNTPVLCRVRQRVTEHGAEDVDAPARRRK